MSVLDKTSVDLDTRSRWGVVVKPRSTSLKKSVPSLEELDKLVLLSVGCPVISGFVYLDVNQVPALTNNGHLDPGEQPLAGAQVLLYDSNNVLVGSTTTDINGAYSFDGLPNTNVTPVTTAAQTITLGSTPTPFSDRAFNPSAISLFDPELGTLTSVSVTHTATVNSNLVAQNPAPIPISITALLNGSYQINGLPQPIVGSGSATAGPVIVPADNPADPAANDLPVNLTVAGAPTTQTFTSASDLAFFTASAGRTTISPTMSATADATISGAGVQFTKVTTASGSLTITFTYTPKVCIPNGQYTLVQIPHPEQLINGKPSQPTVVFPAPPVGQPQILHVTVNDVDLPDNNFAKLPSGFPGDESCPSTGPLVRYGVHHQQTQLVLSFVGTVNPEVANNPASYFVTSANGRTIRIVSATFDPTTNSVTLIPARNLNVHHKFDLSVVLPCTPSAGNTTVIRFGGRNSLGGFENHRGQFVPVANGHRIRHYGLNARAQTLAQARAHRARG